MRLDWLILGQSGYSSNYVVFIFSSLWLLSLCDDITGLKEPHHSEAGVITSFVRILYFLIFSLRFNKMLLEKVFCSGKNNMVMFCKDIEPV